ADRHVDEEDRAPAECRDVEGDEPSAQAKSDRGAEAEREAEDAERTAALVIAEQAMDGRENLRYHQRSGRSLRRARRHQLATRARQAAPRGGQGETHETEQEYRLRSADIAETSTGDDQRGERDLIKHDDSLDLAGGCVEVGADRGDRHVDDERVDHEDELG